MLEDTNDIEITHSDAPHLAPRNLKPYPKQGRNEPCFLQYVAEAIAQARGCSTEEIIHHSTKNSIRFFNLNG